jgi:hypothetical protein
MPVFRDSSSTNRTAENDYSAENGVVVPAFLRTPHAQSGFKEGIRRMECDQKPAIRASRVDFDNRNCFPISAFVGTNPHIVPGRSRDVVLPKPRSRPLPQAEISETVREAKRRACEARWRYSLADFGKAGTQGGLPVGYRRVPLRRRNFDTLFSGLRFLWTSPRCTLTCTQHAVCSDHRMHVSSTIPTRAVQI